MREYFTLHRSVFPSYLTIESGRIKNIRADDTLDLTFQGHFQGHKVKKWQKITIFIYNAILLGVNSSHPCYINQIYYKD